MKKLLQLAGVIATLALASVAQQANTRVYHDNRGWVEETTGAIPAAANLRIQSAQGSVVLHGADQPNVTYVVRKRVLRGNEDNARRQFQSFNISAATRANTAMIVGEWVGASNGRMTVEYQVRVPRRTELAKIHTLGGSIQVQALQGKLYAQTAGGSISLADIGGLVNASTAGGSIELNSGGSDVLVKTAGGSINVGSANGTVRASTHGGSIQLGSSQGAAILETLGGSIIVRKVGSDLRASTAGGNIEVGDVNGGATLSTAGGSIRLDSARGLVRASTAGGGMRLRGLAAGLHAENAAGTIYAEFVGPRASFKDSHLETAVGDITVFLPEDIGVTVRAAIEMAQGHNIRSDFSNLKISSDGGNFGPREIYCEGSINGGGPLLKVHATTGNIEIRRTRR